MSLRRVAPLSLAVVLVTAIFTQSADKKPIVDVDDAIRCVEQRGHGIYNMGPNDLQVMYRLVILHSQEQYACKKEHLPAWKACMLDEGRSMYARLCAVYFLLEHDDEEARAFITSQIASKNLRYRHNAAKIVQMHVGDDPKKQWGIGILLKLLEDGSVDGPSGRWRSPRGDYPEGDRDDAIFTPLDDICRSFGFMKHQQAVPGLIAVLQRRPATWGAATALGEIGDQRGAPILLRVLEDRSGWGDSEVEALGQLKYTNAVPALIARLGHPRTDAMEAIETEKILEALLAIGDQRAVAPIEKYLKGHYPEQSKAVARRVLVQLKSPNPILELLELLDTEPYEPERSDLISALAKFHDKRIVKKFDTIARTSESAYMRNSAIHGLSQTADKQSLLALAALLDVTYPSDSEARGKGFVYFKELPDTIVHCLRRHTRQDFGTDRGKWEQWINENVESAAADGK